MAENDDYGKRPLWQWILIYIVIGAIVYGVIYYFVLANKGGFAPYSSQSTPSSQTTPAPSTPSIPGY